VEGRAARVPVHGRAAFYFLVFVHDAGGACAHFAAQEPQWRAGDGGGDGARLHLVHFRAPGRLAGVEAPVHVRPRVELYRPRGFPEGAALPALAFGALHPGGVGGDLIHEWDYLYWLFGPPVQVRGYAGKVSCLDIDSDDVAIYIASYKKMTVELHLDYFGRFPVRQLELLTENDTIIADLIRNEIRFLVSGNKISFSEERNVYHQKELEMFFSLVMDNKGSYMENPNPPETANEVLKIAQCIESV